MQTFVPIATTDFAQIAKVLDNKRLNKQALEGWQILMTLWELDPAGEHRTPKGWVNHPATKMWRGHEFTLYQYIIAMTNEWIDRGFKTTIGVKASATLMSAYEHGLFNYIQQKPYWMEDQRMFESMASSHRLALLTKDYEHYSQFGWAEDAGVAPETYEYVWG